jgi:hypothetical protein
MGEAYAGFKAQAWVSNYTAEAKRDRFIYRAAVRYRPRLCKNVAELLKRSKADQISRFYAKSRSAEQPNMGRLDVEAWTH